jgi:hypothetical protein
VEWFACRRPLAESRLEALGEIRLRELLDPEAIRYALGKNLEAESFKKEQEGELWRWLALSAGVVLLLELFAAWWFGRK